MTRTEFIGQCWQLVDAYVRSIRRQTLQDVVAENAAQARLAELFAELADRKGMQ